MNKMFLFAEWFGGVGAWSHAIHRLLGIDQFKIHDYVELDKYAVNAFNAINKTNFKPTDINDVDVSNYPELDVLIAGWPCQDYSVAGRGLGLEGTRSSLILLTISKIKEMKVKPKHILLENVKGLLSSTHKEDLAYIKELFTEMGYQWDQALLNSKFFGIPQARERVFMLLTRNDLPKVEIKHLEERNTIDKVLGDILDFDEPTHSIRPFDVAMNNPTNSNKYNEVGVPYTIYFKNEMSQYNGKIIELDIDKFNNQAKDKINKVATLGTLENDMTNDIKIVFKDHSFNQKKHFLGIEGVSKTLRAGDCDTENKIIFAKIPFNQDSAFTGINGMSNTLVANSPDFKNKVIYHEETVLHYRKLSTLECWRLMGFSDEAHNSIKNLTTQTKSGKQKRLVSDSQMAKQAGNSIVVNVLEAIAKEIFNPNRYILKGGQ